MTATHQRIRRIRFRGKILIFDEKIAMLLFFRLKARAGALKEVENIPKIAKISDFLNGGYTVL